MRRVVARCPDHGLRIFALTVRCASNSPEGQDASALWRNRRSRSLPALDPALRYKGGKVEVGHWESTSKTFGENEVREFSKLSGDENPVHLDESFAAATQFKKRIVHGFLAASLISATAGLKLPGPGSIYLTQSLSFKRPVYLADTVTATIIVMEVDRAKRRVLFDTYCTNQANEVVIFGEALTLAPEETL